MHIPERGTSIVVSRAGAVVADPLEVIFADTEEWVPPREADLDRRVTYPNLGTYAGYWNSGFHAGQWRDVQQFAEFFPIIRELHNPNVAIAPRIHGFSELHVVLASLCPDEVLARYQLTRRSANFLLSPISLDGDPRSEGGSSPGRLKTKAEACCAAFRDFVWSRVIQRGRKRLRKGDFDSSASLRVLLDDSPFWMNAIYRMALGRARERLSGSLPLNLPIEFMNNWRIHDWYGHMAGALPTLRHGELLEVRQADGRVLFRKCRVTPRGEGKPKYVVPPGAIVMDEMVFVNNLEELNEQARHGDGKAYQPIEPTFIDSGLRVLPVLQGGGLWDPANPRDREDALDEMLSLREMASIDSVVGLLTRDVLLEDLSDRGWSHLKEDVKRRFYHKPRKGRKGFKVEVRETVDDLPVLDSNAMLVDGEDVLRSVMVTLDPREQRVIVLLRAGRTRNQVAADVGFKDHSGLSRILVPLEARFRRAMGLPPAVKGRKSRPRRQRNS